MRVERGVVVLALLVGAAFGLAPPPPDIGGDGQGNHGCGYWHWHDGTEEHGNPGEPEGPGYRNHRCVG